MFEQMLIDDGILLRKYWFSVSEEEQLRRFKARRKDPVRQWKLSPMDLESLYKWEDYSRARDEMMADTDKPSSPWFLVESELKKHARLNMIAILSSTMIDDRPVKMPKVKLPARPIETGHYQRPPRELSTYVDDHVATLLGADVPDAGSYPGDAGDAAPARHRRVAATGERYRVRGDPEVA